MLRIPASWSTSPLISNLLLLVAHPTLPQKKLFHKNRLQLSESRQTNTQRQKQKLLGGGNLVKVDGDTFPIPHSMGGDRFQKTDVRFCPFSFFLSLALLFFPLPLPSFPFILSFPFPHLPSIPFPFSLPFLSHKQQHQSSEGQKYHTPWTWSPQAQLGGLSALSRRLKAPGYRRGGLPSLSTALDAITCLHVSTTSPPMHTWSSQASIALM